MIQINHIIHKFECKHNMWWRDLTVICRCCGGRTGVRSRISVMRPRHIPAAFAEISVTDKPVLIVTIDTDDLPFV